VLELKNLVVANEGCTALCLLSISRDAVLLGPVVNGSRPKTF
jgi:hypothetical protein